MKRYERMSKEDIINLFRSNVDPLTGTVSCDRCPLRGTRECLENECCDEVIIKWLEGDVTERPRVYYINTAEQLQEQYEKFDMLCSAGNGCSMCRYNVKGWRSCFAAYLKEEVTEYDL